MKMIMIRFVQRSQYFLCDSLSTDRLLSIHVDWQISCLDLFKFLLICSHCFSVFKQVHVIFAQTLHFIGMRVPYFDNDVSFTSEHVQMISLQLLHISDRQSNLLEKRPSEVSYALRYGV